MPLLHVTTKVGRPISWSDLHACMKPVGIMADLGLMQAQVTREGIMVSQTQSSSRLSCTRCVAV